MQSALGDTEVIRRRGPWKGIEDVEFATLTSVARIDSSGLLEPLGYVPPIEFEAAYHSRSAVAIANGSQDRRRATIG